MTHATNRDPVPAGFRPDVQGLRAIAVLLVIAYHLYPNRVSGGYVGVDVFFVISGYLITAHLVREASLAGRVSLRRFWARRLRRLLPASLLVLAVCTVLMLVWLPQTQWDQTIRQILASTLYMQNWALAADSVDYLALGNSPTLTQHYWSLSVEEQFYIVWPVLVVASLLGVRASATGGAARVRRRLIAVVALLVGVSLVHSVHLTATDPGPAYFVTSTRVWELGIGALLATVALPVLPRQMARLAGWFGVLAIVVAGMLYDSQTPFPGFTALMPTLGAAAVIVAATDGSRWSPGWWLSLRPATFIGDISYAMYLWHWPLIVITPYVIGLDLRTRDKATILLATILLSWLSTRLVEDPVRRARLMGGRPWRTFAASAAAMAVVVAGTAAAQWEGDRRAERLEATPPATGCLGPAALDPRNDCTDSPDSGTFVAAPAKVVEQNATPPYPGCQAGITSSELTPCTLGHRGQPRRTVALVGDSHATQWFSTFDELAAERRWRVLTYARASCPLTLAVRTLPSETTDEAERRCLSSNQEVLTRLAEDREVDTVFVTSYTSAYGWDAPSETPMDDPATEGFRRAWQHLVDAGKQVVVIRAVPLVKDKDNAPDCLIQHLDDVTRCSLPRAAALPEDLAATAVRSMDRGAALVDLTDQFCDDRRCHAAVGQVIVYRDYSHLSREYATLLAPYLGRAFDRVDEAARG